MTTFRVEFTDARGLLAAAAAFLAAEPVASSVLNTVASRLVDVPPPAGRPQWFALVREGDSVVGAAMRTAPFAPYPLYVVAMPDGAARALAVALRERGEDVPAVNGVVPAARVVAEELAQGRPLRDERQHFYELTAPIAPRPASGALRAATVDDLELAYAWFNAFHAAALAQSGRDEPFWSETFSRDDVRQRVEAGNVFFWVDGTPKQMTVQTPPSFGVSRIQLVYTPEANRGHGYASAAVHAVACALLADGVRVCLSADEGNATSNKIYEAIGFRRLFDTANHVL